MLQQRRVSRAVDVAEVEQPLPDVGRHLETLVAHAEAAQGTRLGVGDPDVAVGDAVRGGTWPLAIAGFVVTLGSCFVLAGQSEPDA